MAVRAPFPSHSLTRATARAAERLRASRCVIVLSLLLLAAPGCEVHSPASFEAPSLLAQVQLGRERVFVGERFTFRVRVVGGVQPGVPDVSVLRDFDVEYVRRNHFPSRRETLFHYFLKARHAGALEIPPIPVSGGGARTKTAAARIEARLPENPGSFRLFVEPERETGYIGQQIFVRFRFECDAEAENIRFEAPFLEDERFVAFLDRPPFRRLPDGYERVGVGRDMAVARIELGVQQGRKVLHFAAVVIPQRAGRIPLPSASAIATIPSLPDAAAGRGEKQVMLDSPTGEIRGDGEQRGFVYSEPSVLQIHALPQQGIPASFGGLVGRYEVTAEAVPPAITLGDPLELVVSLSGQPYLAEAAIPDLRGNAALLENFEARRAGGDPAIGQGRKIFRYDLRPRRSGDLAIPAIPFSYFDPDSGRYVEARSAAVRVAVAENRVVTAADAEGASEENPPPLADAAQLPGPGEPAAGRGGVAANVPLESATVASVISGAVAVLRSPLVVGGILAPPLVVLLIWLARRFARRRIWRSSSPAALSPLERFEKEFAAQCVSGGQTLGQPGRASEAVPDAAARSAFQLLRQYLGSRLGLSGSSMTFGDVAALLRARGVSSGLIAQVERLFAGVDAARYGAGPDIGGQAGPSQVRNLVIEIERELRVRQSTYSA